ncbi:MAG: hypothetical protein IPP71_20905 [Bacteroidetes bacterium]|nr:hypothetical protein [Bacteroidota bacterium]
MQHRISIDSNQLSFGSLEEIIAGEDPFRFLDVLMEKQDLATQVTIVNPIWLFP